LSIQPNEQAGDDIQELERQNIWKTRNGVAAAFAFILIKRFGCPTLLRPYDRPPYRLIELLILYIGYFPAFSV